MFKYFIDHYMCNSSVSFVRISFNESYKMYFFLYTVQLMLTVCIENPQFIFTKHT